MGIVGFSFGLRDEEPNPSNMALAVKLQEITDDLEIDGRVVVVVTQWEITKALDKRFGTDFYVDLSVEQHTDGTYLDSDDVWAAAKERFVYEGVTQVIIVAQPFLHLPKLKGMVTKDGYEVVDYEIGAIPFDNTDLNTQPWTRSKTALAIYAGKSLLGMKRGHNGMQNAT